MIYAGDDEDALNAMRSGIEDLRHWMVSDHLELNDDKTEFLLIGTRLHAACKG